MYMLTSNCSIHPLRDSIGSMCANLPQSARNVYEPKHWFWPKLSSDSNSLSLSNLVTVYPYLVSSRTLYFLVTVPLSQVVTSGHVASLFHHLFVLQPLITWLTWVWLCLYNRIGAWYRPKEEVTIHYNTWSTNHYTQWHQLCYYW